MLLTRWLQNLFQARKENVQKFLGVLLYGCIGRVAFKIFKGKTETQRVKGLPL
jgi:hypothetical protein